ncbi:MAG: hypothetical protein LBC98_06145 [Prevotellaceae bacterium]|jgi:hypothetical protein|nr:hypothetical protein [Prevotellaceae bacterium]
MWKANKLINILLWVLAGLSVLLCVYVFVRCAGMDEASQKEDMLGVISPLFLWMYALIGVTALLSVFLPVPHVVENPKSGKGVLIGIAGFLAVIGLAYIIASGEGELKFAGINLIAIYLMLGGTVLSLIVSSIYNFIKSK